MKAYLIIASVMTSVVLATHSLWSNLVTNYGDPFDAIYHVRIKECGRCDGLYFAITSIIEHCDATHHGLFYFTITMDEEQTCICRTSAGVITKGNLDMSIEKMDGTGGKRWVHRKDSHESIINNDWPSVYERLCKSMKEISGSRD